jgi:hypothetical protein
VSSALKIGVFQFVDVSGDGSVITTRMGGGNGERDRVKAANRPWATCGPRRVSGGTAGMEILRSLWTNFH